MKKRVAIIITAVVALLAGAGVWYYYASRPAMDMTEPALPATTQPEPAPQKEETAQVALPGADAVDARVEDYNNPSSLWVVVNKDLPLSDPQYRPSDLTLLADTSRTDKSNDERSIRAVAVADFNAMVTEAKTAGYDLIIGSGFRPYALQATYYNNYVATYGLERANQFSAKPGYSEHQTGLTADITVRSMQCYLDTCFGDTAAGKWLAANAPNYGFIIRYPADKTDITKYQYEPWHVRYVGKPLAGALKQSGLTLDEAYPYLQSVRAQLIEAKKITVQ